MAQGFDSPELSELADLTRDESRTNGARLLRAVLASLGWPMRDLSGSPEELPWLGYWYQIAWAKTQLDRLVTPYAAAQRVIEVAGDVPDLWIPAGGDVWWHFSEIGTSIRPIATRSMTRSAGTCGRCANKMFLR